MPRFLLPKHACLSLVGGLFIGLMGCSNEDTSDASNQPSSAKSSVSAESSGANSSEEGTHAKQGSSDESALAEMEDKLRKAACTEQGVPSEMWVEREQIVLKLQDESQQQEWRNRLDAAQFEPQCLGPAGATP